MRRKADPDDRLPLTSHAWQAEWKTESLTEINFIAHLTTVYFYK